MPGSSAKNVAQCLLLLIFQRMLQMHDGALLRATCLFLNVLNPQRLAQICVFFQRIFVTFPSNFQPHGSRYLNNIYHIGFAKISSFAR